MSHPEIRPAQELDNESALKCLLDIHALGPEVSQVIVLTKLRDGTFQTSMSDMRMSDACLLMKHLDMRIQDYLR